MSNTDKPDDLPFWKTTALSDMTATQWESLCDGCGKCCLNKLINDENEIFFTSVACWLLDLGTCKCSDYANRKDKVPDCQVLTPENVGGFRWMPATCGYRLVAEGKDLHYWHPLLSGNADSVHRAGISVRGRARSEEDVLDLEDHIVDWPA